MELVQTFSATPLNFTHYVLWVEDTSLQAKGFNNEEDAQIFFDGLRENIKRSLLLQTITERYISDVFEPL